MTITSKKEPLFQPEKLQKRLVKQEFFWATSKDDFTMSVDRTQEKIDDLFEIFTWSDKSSINIEVIRTVFIFIFFMKKF